MAISIGLRGQTKKKQDEYDTDRLLLLRRENENFRPRRLGQGRRAAASANSDQPLRPPADRAARGAYHKER